MSPRTSVWGVNLPPVAGGPRRPGAPPGRRRRIHTSKAARRQPAGVQIVGYERGIGDGADSPALRLADGSGSLERVVLAPGVELSYSLDERHCAGVVDGDVHVACDAPAAPYCDEHTDRWACARCTGGCDRPLPACREPHAVYLAAFAPATFKVGVTREWRLDRRLREQGADRAALLRTVADGRIAREFEAEIAAEVGDRVRVPAKIRGLHRSVDEAAWADLLAAHPHEETFAFEYGLALTDRPMRETIATGTVRGLKGRVLVLDTAGGTYAVDLRDLLGHDVQAGPTDRDLQASLGAWD